MINETSYQTAPPLGESPLEEAEKMALWTEELEPIDLCKVDRHEKEHENDLIDNEILYCYISREEPAGGPIED